MMRRSVGIAVVVVLVAAGVLAWQRCDRGASSSTGAATGSSAPADPIAARRAAHAQAAATPSAAASLSGTVTRKADGAPVPGAIVALVGSSRTADLGSMGGGGGDSSATILAVADARGAWTASPLLADTFAVSATAAGYAPATLTGIAVAAGEQRAGLALVVDAAAATLHGTVSDIGGGPIGGARISAHQRDTRKMFAAAPELVTLAAADGTYALALADGTWEVAASHDDYTRVRKRVELAGTAKKLDFVLVPGATIRGEVVARDGKPVEGAVVSAGTGRASMSMGGITATSDATGAFTLHGLRSGTTSLTARGRGYASATPTVVDLGIGESLDGVRVVVDRAFTISGFVVRKGKPAEGLPGVHVAVFSIAAKDGAPTREASGSDGYFEIVGVRPASYMLFALGEAVVPEMGKNVEVVDRDVGDVVIEMATGATVSGRVEPPGVASLSLAVETIGLGNLFDVAKAALVHADADGTGAFTLHHVPAGAFTLLATTAGGQAGKLPLAMTDADQSGLVVTLEQRASLSGRIVDANHAPMPGLRVMVAPAKLDAKSAIQIAMASSDSVLTGDDGTFRAVGLDAGKVSLSVSDERGALPWSGRDKPNEPIEFELTAARETAAGTLAVEASDAVIHGSVVGADGGPAADAWVTARLEDEPGGLGMAVARARMGAGGGGGGGTPVLSGPDGKFVIEHLRRGTYSLVVEGPRGLSRGDAKGVKTGDTVTVTLTSLGTVTGHVTAGGAPVASFDIECKGVVTSSRHVTADDGAYVIERLAPGHYACDATADTGTATGSVDVPSGPATLDLAIVPWASVTGVVVSVLNGSPLAGLKIMASGTGDPSGSLAAVLTGGGPTTDATGRFEVDQLGAGSGTLSVLPAAGSFDALATRKLALVPGQLLDLGTIKVVPPRTGDAGTLGMGTSVEGAALVVDSVAAGGPAASAGVAVGDKIVSIDGAPVADIGAALVKTALGAGTIAAGQTFTLVLDRGGTPVTASLTAAKW